MWHSGDLQFSGLGNNCGQWESLRRLTASWLENPSCRSHYPRTAGSPMQAATAVPSQDLRWMMEIDNPLYLEFFMPVALDKPHVAGKFLVTQHTTHDVSNSQSVLRTQ